MKLPLEGGCLCGAVRYRISAEPHHAGYCHCRMCQRSAGAPVVAWLTGAERCLRLDQGRARRLSLLAQGRAPVLPDVRHPARVPRACRARSPGRHACQPRRSRGGAPGPSHLDLEPDRLVRCRRRSAALPGGRSRRIGLNARAGQDGLVEVVRSRRRGSVKSRSRRNPPAGSRRSPGVMRPRRGTAPSAPRPPDRSRRAATSGRSGRPRAAAP